MSLSSVDASGLMYHARGTATDDTSATVLSTGLLASAAPALTKVTSQDFETFGRDVHKILERMKYRISDPSSRKSLPYIHIDDDNAHKTL